MNISRQKGLDSHNDFRARHKSPALTIDENINNFAQNYAEYLARYNKFEHNANRQYGENLYQQCSFPNPPNAKGK